MRIVVVLVGLYSTGESLDNRWNQCKQIHTAYFFNYFFIFNYYLKLCTNLVKEAYVSRVVSIWLFIFPFQLYSFYDSQAQNLLLWPSY